MDQPVKQDLKCYRGQTYSKTILIKKNGNPIDLTGVTAKAQIRPNENSNNLTAEFSCEIGSTAGRITMGLSAEQTSAIRPGSYYWDIKTIEADGTVTYWMRGKFIVNGRVTV